MTVDGNSGGDQVTMEKPSPGTIRSRRLRERRRNGWTGGISIEVDAIDAVAFREAAHPKPGEPAVDALPFALRRLVASVR